MTVQITPLSVEELDHLDAERDAESGAGALSTDRGNLPLDTLDVRVAVTGLVARTVLSQGFRNPYDVPLEATYIFPLPPRAAVSAMRMEAAGRVVDAELAERGAARERYDEAIASGQRASIAEEERPDVFTMRVGNIPPGERVTVRLTMDGPLPYADGSATYRFPLVVAPRYIPGAPLPGGSVGDGAASDTDAVPDASRITPPVLLPGFPNPVRLSLTVDIDAAGLPLTAVRSSLHTVDAEESGTGTRVRIRPGERIDRDFVLRLGYGSADGPVTGLTVVTDDEPAEPDTYGTGTFRLTVLPPVGAPSSARGRDVVLLLDRSGSMGGWKMVAARRAAARIVDTLTAADRFAVLLFDHAVERPPGLPDGLVAATDRNRFRAVEALARTDSRGGTDLLRPLTDGADLLVDETRDRVLVLVTDGQVGNEDQLVAAMTDPLSRIRVHTVGIDQAVNAGFLGRLAGLGRGRCELVESEDRLDEAMDRIHRRIAAPVVAGLRLSADGLDLLADTLAPSRLPDLFDGAPIVVAGRLRGATTGAITLSGTRPDGAAWSTRVPATATAAPAATPVWARGHLRDLEDRYLAGRHPDASEARIVATSLRFGVLCRFTAFVAVDSRVVTEGGTRHRVTQPVELPAGWEPPAAPTTRMMAATRSRRAAAPDLFGAAMAPMAQAGGAAPAAAPAPGGAAPGGPPSPLPTGGYGGGAPGFAPPRAPAPPPPDPSTVARRQLADELRRLRATTPSNAAESLAVLGDLGSRLAVLTGPLGTDGATLAALVDRLRACDGAQPPRGDQLDELWRDTLAVLAELAGRVPDPATARPSAQPPAAPRRSFWKRG